MHKKIPVYKAEAELGLKEAITSPENRSVLAYCPVILEDSISSDIKNFTKADKIPALASDSDQFDLHYIFSILATTGWNRNDDVFDRAEMWAARNSAEDKPFNKGHNPKEIIGHITGNAVVNQDFELVDNDSDFDSLPDKFHVLTSAVLYKHISSRDENLTLSTKELLEEISDGKWFVSMEALFSNFDYALVTAEGEEKIISRNEDTAFLSKHLRSYGGVGEYNGMKVGRLMRNLTFSGKGLVHNPGNPESIIFKEEDNVIFKGVADTSPDISLLVTSSSKGDSSMSDNNEQVRSLESQVEKLEARLKSMDEEKIQAQISDFETACADKDAEISQLSTKLEAANEVLEASKKSYAELQESKAECDSKIAELSEKLEAIEASAVRTSRISALVDVDVDKADAEVLVDTFDGVTEDQFDAIVSLHADYMMKKKAGMHKKDEEKKSESGAHDEDEKKKKKEEESAKAPFHKDKEKKAESPMHYKKAGKHKDEEKEAKADLEDAIEATEESADAEILENAEADNEPALATQSEDNVEAVVASLNEYFDEVLSGPNNKS